MLFRKIPLPEKYPISHVFSHRKELLNLHSVDKKVTSYIDFQAELVRRLSTNQFMQSFPIPGIERHLPLFRKRMFLINNGPQPTMEAARLAWSNRKLRSGSKSENARRNDAIYDRERRTTKRRKKRKKSAENLKRPTEGRYVPLHLSSRPFPSVYVRIRRYTCVSTRVRAYVRSHMSTGRMEMYKQHRGMFFSLGSREKGLNVLLLNHNVRGRVVGESGRDRTNRT